MLLLKDPQLKLLSQQLLNFVMAVYVLMFTPLRRCTCMPLVIGRGEQISQTVLQCFLWGLFI